MLVVVQASTWPRGARGKMGEREAHDCAEGAAADDVDSVEDASRAAPIERGADAEGDADADDSAALNTGAEDATTGGDD